MEQNHGTDLQEQLPDTANDIPQTDSASSESSCDKIVTSYGVVTREYVESLIKNSGQLGGKPRKSVGKRILSWFFGIVGCIAFLFSCVCMCYYAYNFVFAGDSDSPGSITIPYDGDFFYVPDGGADSEDNEETSDSDIYFENARTSNAGLGVIVSALDTSTAQMYGIPGGLVIVGIPEVSSFNGTDVRVYDIITGAEGAEITSTSALSVLLNKREIGDDFTVTITRFTDGFAESFDVTVSLIDKTA